MNIKKILKRITRSPEEKTIDYIKKHASLCEESVKYLFKALDALTNNVSKDKMKELLKVVEDYEEEADSLRRRIIEMLTIGTLPPLNREDFVRLMEKMDMIADWAKDAARVLSVMDLKFFKGKILLCSRRSAELAWESTTCLKEAVKFMEEDFNKSLTLTQRIERIEEEADTMYLNCLKELERISDVSSSKLILIEKVAETIENLNDAVEDTSDVLKAIIVRNLR